MKKSVIFFVLAFSVNAFAHQAFVLVSSEKKTIKSEDLVKIEAERTAGKKDGSTITFTENEIRLVILTGPEDDMLSYRILGIRNPTLVVPSGATLKILFVNSDEDMSHDVRFGIVAGDFTLAPAVTETAGTTRLDHMTADETMQAEEIVLKATADGVYKYFCSVRGHAKGGMWGNIAVGVKPADITPPPKTTHVHSPDEDKMDDMPGMQKASPTPSPHVHDQAMPTSSPTPALIDTNIVPESFPPNDELKIAKVMDAATKSMGDMKHDHGTMKMSSVTNIGDPMERESSGTAWAPDSSPMYAKVKMYEDGGMLMLMGTAFVRYTSIGSTRDVSVAGKGSHSRADAPSMFMLMYSRPINEKSQLGLRAMFSLDPIIQRGWGYPLLYQSGEVFRGAPIHDRQHPHDLVSELAITYSYKFDDKKSFYMYAGYPGEPALGPPVFVHRLSASNNPDAPIGHHWQDATHITWGVVTGGFSLGKVKIEASVFKGEEPNENRWNFDKPRLDSFSGRLSWNPTKNWAFQISHGYLKNPEPAEPEVKILHKTTASAIYNKKFDDNRNWASTFIWGQNYANGQRTNSFLIESNYDLYKNAIFGRFEHVQKSGHDLVLDHALEDKIFGVNAFSLGYVRDIFRGKGLDVGVGAMATINTNPAALTPYYGGTTHGGWQVFMRFRPSKMTH